MLPAWQRTNPRSYAAQVGSFVTGHKRTIFGVTLALYPESQRDCQKVYSADFTLICDRQHDITGSRTRDLTTPEQRSSRLRHELPHANTLATQRMVTHNSLRMR